MIDIASRVRDVVAAEIGVEPSALAFTDNLTTDHGLDDLDLVSTAMRLEEVFGVELSDASLQEVPTIANCIEQVRQGLLPV